MENACCPSSTSSRPGEVTGRILELDGLRAFAVVAVVLYHMSQFSGALPKGEGLASRLISELGNGGVRIFFVISGYIITTLLLREKERAGTVLIGNFYVRRFFRIVPPLAVFLVTLGALRSMGMLSVGEGNLWRAILFLGHVIPFQGERWLVAHTWSLSVEEQFYLLFPPVFCVLLKCDGKKALPLLGLAYLLAAFSWQIVDLLDDQFGVGWGKLRWASHFRHIIVGVMMSVASAQILPFLRGRSRAWPFFLALSALGLQLWPSTEMESTWCGAIEPWLCGLFVLWFTQNPERCRILRLSAVQKVGACSYSIYLWQQLFTAPPTVYHGWSVQNPSFVVLAIGACAVLSYLLIERPSSRVGRLLSERRRPLPSRPSFLDQGARLRPVGT